MLLYKACIYGDFEYVFKKQVEVGQFAQLGHLGSNPSAFQQGVNQSSH